MITTIRTNEQQKETVKRLTLYKTGKMKGYTLEQVHKRVKQKLGK
jgi:hypothetical protein